MLIKRIDINSIPSRKHNGHLVSLENDDEDIIFNSKDEVVFIRNGEFAIKWIGYGKKEKQSQDAPHPIKTETPKKIQTQTIGDSKTEVQTKSVTQKIQDLMVVTPLTLLYPNLRVNEIEYLLSEFEPLNSCEWEFMDTTVIMSESDRQEYCKLYSDLFEGIKAKHQISRLKKSLNSRSKNTANLA